MALKGESNGTVRYIVTVSEVRPDNTVNYREVYECSDVTIEEENDARRLWVGPRLDPSGFRSEFVAGKRKWHIAATGIQLVMYLDGFNRPGEAVGEKLIPHEATRID